MRQAFILGLSALISAGRVSAEGAASGQLAGRSGRPQAASPFQVTAATPLGNATKNIASGALNLEPVGAWNTEEVTVYAKHHPIRPPDENREGVALGSAFISTRNTTDQIGFAGMTVTAALPVPGVPGLEAVANLSGGHDAVNASTTRQAAVLTAGLRLKF